MSFIKGASLLVKLSFDFQEFTLKGDIRDKCMQMVHMLNKILHFLALLDTTFKGDNTLRSRF